MYQDGPEDGLKLPSKEKKAALTAEQLCIS